MDKLQKDLIILIASKLERIDLTNFTRSSDLIYNKIGNNVFWNTRLLQDYGLKIKVVNPRVIYLWITVIFSRYLYLWEENIRQYVSPICNNYLDFEKVKLDIINVIIDFVNNKEKCMKLKNSFKWYYDVENILNKFLGPKINNGYEYEAITILQNCTKQLYQLIQRNITKIHEVKSTK